jgi:hypothetical protein
MNDFLLRLLILVLLVTPLTLLSIFEKKAGKRTRALKLEPSRSLLDGQSATSVTSKDRCDCNDEKEGAEQEQTESGATNLSDCDAASAGLNRKGEV